MTAIDLQSIRVAYYDNANYEEAGSVAKAKAFVTACRRILALAPQEIKNLDAEHAMPDARLVQAEISSARLWISANDTTSGGSVFYSDLTHFRE